MSCKLPSCYPVSIENIENIENFETTPLCAPGYLYFNSPNADCQSVLAGSNPTTYYILDHNSKTGDPKPDGYYQLPDPTTGPGIKGWSIIVKGEGNTPVTTTVATHSIASGSPGYSGGNANCGPYITNPHQITFVDDAKVKDIQAILNHRMNYCLLPPPSQPKNVTISNINKGSFTATWASVIGETSYTYSLNGNPIIPTTDNGMTKNSAIFTGVPANDSNTLIVTAVNLSGPTNSDPSVSFSIPDYSSSSSPSSYNAGVSISFSPDQESPSTSNSSFILFASIGGVVLIIFILMLMMGGKKN
jgi:hypothetical protein